MTDTTIEARIEELTPALYKIAFRFSTFDLQADDIFQGMVEKIISSCKPTDTRSFICQCVTWHAKNMLNSERIYKQYFNPSYEESDDEGEEFDIIELSVSNDLTPEEYVLRNEIASSIKELMSSVNDTNREILTLLIMGETHQAIAEEIHVTRTAVSNRIQRMRGEFQLAGLLPV